VPELSASENIFLDRLGASFWINWTTLHKKAQSLVDELGFTLDVRKKVAELSVAEQQVVEIAKALTRDIKLIIFDEPSDVLGAHEVAILYKVLEKLKAKDIAIVYISHHLPEILQISDTITILRDGKSVASVPNQDLDNNKLIALMLGRALQAVSKPAVQFRQEQRRVFAVSGIRLPMVVSGDVATAADSTSEVPMHDQAVSFTARSGEILGIAGLVGSGRTELLRAIFGADAYANRTKKIRINDQPVAASSPRLSMTSGLGMVPEDRKKEGGILMQSIKENISITNYNQIKRKFGFLDHQAEIRNVESLVQRLKIKCSSIEAPVGSLSGGNQQKVILAKWINSGADILLIDEPTRGVDVGARAQIYDILFELAAAGKTLIVVSSDLEELMSISDRILVMQKGQFSGEVLRADFSEEKLLRLAIE